MPGQTSMFDRHLQWRAGQLPGQTRTWQTDLTDGFNRPLTCLALQWRAGQLPGQTGEELAGRRCWTTRQPSMEGARPDVTRHTARPFIATFQWRAGQLPGQTGVGKHRRYPQILRPSMEGRAIARPDATVNRRRGDEPLQWRAGQLPGQTAAGSRYFTGCRRLEQVVSLQWRAGQLPGQTSNPWC